MYAQGPLKVTIEDIHYDFFEDTWKGVFVLAERGGRLVQAKRNILSTSLYKFHYDNRHYMLNGNWLFRIVLGRLVLGRFVLLRADFSRRGWIHHEIRVVAPLPSLA